MHFSYVPSRLSGSLLKVRHPQEGKDTTPKPRLNATAVTSFLPQAEWSANIGLLPF